MLGERFRVELHEGCVKHGGRDEYPDTWEGVEALPSQFMPTALPDESESARLARATALYNASCPVAHEGLRYVAFGKQFAGKNERTGKPKIKTHRHGRLHAMWIPRGLLKRVMPSAEAVAFKATPVAVVEQVFARAA